MKKYIIHSLLLSLLPLTVQGMEGDFDPEFYTEWARQDNTESLYDSTHGLFEDELFLSSIPAQESNIQRIRSEIEVLINVLTDFNDTESMSLFRDACYHEECADLIEILLQKGINPNENHIEFDNPLFIACCSGSITNVTKLLEYNADLNIRNISEITPLMIAIQEGHIEIAQLLLEHKDIQVNAQDKTGNSALMFALKNDVLHHRYSTDKNLRENIIRALLKAKARLDIVNNQCENAIDIAYKNGFDDLAELMKKWLHEQA